MSEVLIKRYFPLLVHVLMLYKHTSYESIKMDFYLGITIYIRNKKKHYFHDFAMTT